MSVRRLRELAKGNSGRLCCFPLRRRPGNGKIDLPLRCACTGNVGMWLSLVEHSLGVRGVGSSNLPIPTITSFNIAIVRTGTDRASRPRAPQLLSAQRHTPSRYTGWRMGMNVLDKATVVLPPYPRPIADLNAPLQAYIA